MYSVVLVMALAGSAEAPDCCHQMCFGGCAGGCYGCSGGCYGCSGTVGRYGCGGGCYGCVGTPVVSYGCGGGCYGGGYSGGCYGGGVGCYGGGYSGGCYGGSVVPGQIIIGDPKTMPKSDMPKGEKIGEPKKSTEAVPSPGTIVVTLPAAAKLTIDGYVSQQTTAERRLVTVPMTPGQTFTYTLVAEINGASQTQTVIVRPGMTSPVNFNFSTTPVAASR